MKDVSTLVQTIKREFKSCLVCAFSTRAIGFQSPRVIIVTNDPLTQDIIAAVTHILKSLTPNDIDITYEHDLRLSIGGYGWVEQNGKIDTTPLQPTQISVFTSHRQQLTTCTAQPVFLCGDNAVFKELVGKAATAIATIRQIEEGLAQVTELPYIKNMDQFLLEQQYLGIHETEESWSEFMQSIAGVGLAAYQTERPLFYQTPAQLQSKVDSSLPLKGAASIKDLVSEMDALVNTYSINQSTVNFMAFPESGNSKAAVAASMLTPLWNQNLISVDKSAPIATFVEVQVIEWLRKLIGYECKPATSAIDIGGVTATGGVMSNTVGILVARSLAFPESRSQGLTAESKTPYLLVADKTLEHYSHKAAFWWLGLGETNVIAVKGTGYNFDINDLEDKLATYNSGDNTVVAVVCMAGDSRTMTIQNIAEVQAMTAANKVWLHVDACQGGIGIFASNREELCADYKLADSISIDPHKGLGVPYSSSFCLFKDQGILQNIAKSTDITIAKGSFDIGQVTPFLGSRPFDTIKLWALIKYHGLDGLAKNVDYRIGLTREWASFVNNSRYLISMNDPLLTAISFSLDPKKLGIEKINGELLSKLNKELHDRCYQTGWLVLHGFDLIDYENRLGLDETRPLRVLGTNFGNVLLDASHFTKIMAYLDTQINKLLSPYCKSS